MDDIDDVSKERSCSSQNMGMAQCGTMEPTSPTWRPRSTRDTLRTPQSAAAKQPGINPDQKKQAIRPETPKMDQNGSSPTRNHRKFPQISKVKKHQSQRSFLSYLVTPFRRALFRQKSMTSTTHLRRYGPCPATRTLCPERSSSAMSCGYHQQQQPSWMFQQMLGWSMLINVYHVNLGRVKGSTVTVSCRRPVYWVSTSTMRHSCWTWMEGTCEVPIFPVFLQHSESLNQSNS